ncbi:MAG: aggregation-promoting factor C-terminal-like domain-containing protein [Candidatus Saccharimonadales bacterium]
MLSRSAWDKYKRSFRRQKRRAKILGRHPLAVPVFTGLALILTTFVLLQIFGNSPIIQVTPNSKIAIVTHDGLTQVVPTNDRTVGDLLSKLHIHLNRGDVVRPNLDTPIVQDDFRINIYRAVPVEIVQNGSVNYTFSAAATPRAIAEQVGTNVTPTDYITSRPTENFLKDGAIGQQVTIESGIPINLNLYGLNLPVFVHASTVAELISYEHIHLNPTDEVSPSINSNIHPNEQVTISGKDIKAQLVTQNIPMPVQTNYVSNLTYGTSSVVQQGSAGQEDVIYVETTNNGAVSKSPFETVVTVPAVTEIVDEGDSLSGIQGDMSLAGISPADYSYVDYIISHESGWCPTKWQGDYGYCPAGYSQQYATDAGVGYGLCQSTPPDKMSSFGSDWQTDPITQLKWCNWYAGSKYGSWYNAYIHWTIYGNW